MKRVPLVLVLLLVGGVLLGATLTKSLTFLPGPLTILGAITQSGGSVSLSGALSQSGGNVTLESLHLAAGLHIGQALAYSSHVVTIRDNGAGGVGNSETVAGNRSLYLITCRDPDACALTIALTNSSPGHALRIVSMEHQNVTLADSGNQHLSAAWTGTPADTLSLVKVCNPSNDCKWYETSRGTN